MILSIEERDQLLARLREEQREYLTNTLTRSRRTVFANAMARDKGYHIPDNADPEDIEILLDDWIYTGYIDAGQVTPDLRCECGRPLRYQHQVQHKSSGDVKKFGIEHLKEHLGIDASVVGTIKKGFDAIDYELDEILVKVNGNWQPDPDMLIRQDYPRDVIIHLELGLPLLERQVNRLRQTQQVKTRNATAYAQVTVSLPRPAEMDLFSWEEQMQQHETVSLELAESLREPLKGYLLNGVHSARVICELLIEQHGARSERYITGKPKIYIPVCLFIEAAYPEARIRISHQEDRIYHLGSNN